jgi:hypothetical protein
MKKFKSVPQISTASKTPTVKKCKSVPQISTTSKMSSVKKRGSSPTSTTASQKSSAKKNKILSQKPNSGRKKDHVNTKPSLGRKQSLNPVLSGKQAETRGTTVPNISGNRNKQTSLTSFFFGKSVTSSGPEASVQRDTSTSNLSDSERRSNQITKENCKMVTPKGCRPSLNEITNVVRGSGSSGPVSSEESVSVDKNPKSDIRKTSGYNTCNSDDELTSNSSEMCNGMAGSTFTTGEPGTSKVTESRSQKTFGATDANKPNAMTLLMSKQKKCQPKQAVEKSVEKVKTSELTIPPAEDPQDTANNGYRKRTCPFYKKIPGTLLTQILCPISI